MVLPPPTLKPFPSFKFASVLNFYSKPLADTAVFLHSIPVSLVSAVSGLPFFLAAPTLSSPQTHFPQEALSSVLRCGLAPLLQSVWCTNNLSPQPWHSWSPTAILLSISLHFLHFQWYNAMPVIDYLPQQLTYDRISIWWLQKWDSIERLMTPFVVYLMARVEENSKAF